MTSQFEIFLTGIAVLATFIILVVLCWLSVWLRNRKDGISPYGTMPLRRGSEVPFETKLIVLRWVYNRKSYENRIFHFNWLSICRETGRIFPNSADIFGHVQVKWTFLQKRYPGHWISWGSLPLERQEEIKRIHGSLEGYQTAFSSPNPAPSRIEPQYALLKPGPLYVDLETNNVMGWQIVPDTNLEVLIVQKPLKIIYPKLEP